LRLLPLLTVVILIVGIARFVKGQSFSSYAYIIAKGVLLPSLPNGGWSITVEFHYYIILPLLLWMISKSKIWPFSIIIAAIALRSFLYHEKGEI
jgi:peptidoglycan/LPS O-acetylase OafA/YrhL